MSGVTYVAVGILALVVIAAAVGLVGRRRTTRISPILAIALGFVVAGIAFGESRWVGYTLMGIGVALAVADALITSRSRD